MTETQTAPVTVHQAWAAVMADVRALAKGERFSAKGGPSYNFRGIDAVMNAAGPVLRQHGVAVIPSNVVANHRDVQTAGGKASREVTVLVTYTVYGPAGDSFTGMAPGESMDTGDKGTAKAMSVALRTFMLQALCLPTDEPDPDSQVYERAPEQAPETPLQTAQRGIAQAQDVATLEQVGRWAAGQGVWEQVADVYAQRRTQLEQGGAAA